ncbi:hypothetical protein R1flu_007857 [Riccia fluitans]|uniref:Peptidase M1 leukotriene A4 hydrolase/aminopeptidase C-terminal domain-containing protein n=1 Tax=Riccia fluitans TaxID=41844 RepID=A0ABD1Z024_9MARC
MAPVDPHSYTDSAHPLTKHVALSISLDFDLKTISGSATFTLERSHSGEIFLDTRDLTIDGAWDSDKKELKYFLEPADKIKGSLLRVVLENDVSVYSVSFKTSQQASALQWLDPAQTAGGKLPYMFTQCQAIHARSIFPCQDTPLGRIKYSADVEIPAELATVMSAAYIGRVPAATQSRVIDRFVMEQPIPPYLFALAVGNITYEEVGPRTRIYAEPSDVKAAAYEFANTESTIKQAEALFGPYDWERFDMLVMPPSFPYGGMENPRMVFLTPTIIVGDRSGVEVVAHELAHSWTGNLISNATANDFWLNEGFTTYAERRIIEAQEGVERVTLHIGLGWQGLDEEIERFKDQPEFTKLKQNQEGVDPDEVYSKVPYEKGSIFLRHLEHKFGRPRFDEFLKNYIQTFRFQSIDTETFVVFLKQQLPEVEQVVDLQTWIYAPGIPEDAVRPETGVLQKVLSLADGFTAGVRLQKSDIEGWEALEYIVYLERLPKKMNVKEVAELESQFHFSESNNWEIKVALLTIAAYSAYEPLFPAIEKALQVVGRMKYLKPLYQGLLESSSVGNALAKRVYEEAKDKYHPIAQFAVQFLIQKFP